MQGHKSSGIITCIILVCVLVSALSINALACTAVYVGAQVSDDGTVIIAKSNDYQSNFANYVCIEDRVENTPGRTMPINNSGSVVTEIAPTTYKYTATPFMDSTRAFNGLGRDATVCANECGVSMEMSITAFTNEAALKADPLIEDGLTEFTAVDLIVCQSATAREGVELLADILDTYGSSECNIAFIADQKEVWYVEMYTGHQYAAVLLPDDKVSVFGNEFTLELLSDYEDSITSPELESLAVENGFARYTDGEFNLYETYSGDEIRTNYSHLRTWIGHKILAESEYGGDYDHDAFYPLCFKPDNKVSLQDVMALIRNRYEGTEYSPDETGKTNVRVIGTDTALSVHILQINPKLPAYFSTVTWESTAPAVYGVFVPISNACTKIADIYSANQPAEDVGKFDHLNYAWFSFKALNTLCVEKNDRPVYGDPVSEYWRKAESEMISGMRKLQNQAAEMDDPDAVSELLTSYCCSVQEQAYADSLSLLNTVMWNKAMNSNTMKNGRNPETHEILDELKALTPIKIDLDSTSYSLSE